MENPIKMDDLGGKPTILGTPLVQVWCQNPNLVEKNHVPDRAAWPPDSDDVIDSLPISVEFS